jgi:type II secretory pathway component HofQ
VAAEKQGALNAPGMSGSSCGFKRVRSRSAKIIKATKKAAHCPKARYSIQSLARRLASLIFLPAASSYHEVLTVAQQAKANAAHAEAKTARPGGASFMQRRV